MITYTSKPLPARVGACEPRSTRAVPAPTSPSGGMCCALARVRGDRRARARHGRVGARAVRVGAKTATRRGRDRVPAAPRTRSISRSPAAATSCARNSRAAGGSGCGSAIFYSAARFNWFLGVDDFSVEPPCTDSVATQHHDRPRTRTQRARPTSTRADERRRRARAVRGVVRSSATAHGRRPSRRRCSTPRRCARHDHAQRGDRGHPCTGWATRRARCHDLLVATTARRTRTPTPRATRAAPRAAELGDEREGPGLVEPRRRRRRRSSPTTSRRSAARRPLNIARRPDGRGARRTSPGTRCGSRPSPLRRPATDRRRNSPSARGSAPSHLDDGPLAATTSRSCCARSSTRGPAHRQLQPRVPRGDRPRRRRRARWARSATRHHHATPNRHTSAPAHLLPSRRAASQPPHARGLALRRRGAAALAPEHRAPCRRRGSRSVRTPGSTTGDPDARARRPD